MKPAAVARAVRPREVNGAHDALLQGLAGAQGAQRWAAG